MRTTLTLDDDVYSKLEVEARRQGKSFKEVVNHYIRMGLNSRRAGAASKPFVVKAMPMGLRPGVSLENIGELLDQIEGPLYR